MIQLHANSSILVATEPSDFRKGIDGFQAVCRYQLDHDPASGTIFVFINRSKTMIRALVYELNGYWLMTKRLSKGKFRNWPISGSSVSTIQAKQLRALLLSNGPANTVIKKINAN